MNDDLLRTLAERAGIETTWRDWSGAEKGVPVETLRALLPLFGLPCATADEVEANLAIVETGPAASTGFFTGRVGQKIILPGAAASEGNIEIQLESGAHRSISVVGQDGGPLILPPIDEPGYHTIWVDDEEYTLAVAPERCLTLRDLVTDGPAWGVAAQIYSLRRPGDGGLGDFGAVADLARAAAGEGADFICISPVHALFAAEPNHISPYSPSSRLVYNPIYADPRAVFSEEIVGDTIRSAGLADDWARLEGLESVDWPSVSRVRMALFRALFQKTLSGDEAYEVARKDFERFRKDTSQAVLNHCTFEALHAHFLKQQPSIWSWRDWPEAYRDSGSEAVRAFVAMHWEEVEFHLFLQWLIDRSHAECQRACREAGMKVGLISDLAIGMDGSGSHGWSRPHEVLTGAGIGSPPDYYNPGGQNWGLTGFSPRELVASGFQPFIETLRTSLRHAGGIRIDHIAGLKRLWLVPEGRPSSEGAYVNYPIETLFRLLTLESWRNKAIVIGEDLGTLPWGFKDQLREQGIAGMRVLRFEHGSDHRYHEPERWDEAAIAMTTTHDAPPTAGWWAGTDLNVPREDGLVSNETEEVRARDRKLLWSAFSDAGVAKGAMPQPSDTGPAVDAAVAFIARTPCQGKLLALEDAIGTTIQPNVPGTINGNWSHRIETPAANIFDDEAVKRRLQPLNKKQAGAK